MPGTPTPILGLAVPTVGGDSGTWGNELNGDLAILDNLGAAKVVSTSTNASVTPGAFPETIVYVTTGAGNVTIGIPAPSTCAGKIFNVKKVDSGAGSVVLAPAAGTIDGQSSWLISGQYSNLRVSSDGTNYNIL